MAFVWVPTVTTKTVACDYGCGRSVTVQPNSYPNGWTPGLGWNNNKDCCNRTGCRINAGLEQPVAMVVQYSRQPQVVVAPYQSAPVIIVDNRDEWDSPPVYTKKMGGGKARVVKNTGGFYTKKM